MYTLPYAQRYVMFAAMHEYEKGFNLHPYGHLRPAYLDEVYHATVRTLVKRHELLKYVDGNPDILTITEYGKEWVEAWRATYEEWLERIGAKDTAVRPVNAYKPAVNDLVMWTEPGDKFYVGRIDAIYPDGAIVETSEGTYETPDAQWLTYLGSMFNRFRRTEMDNPACSVMGDFQGRVIERDGVNYHQNVKIPMLERNVEAYGGRLQIFKICVELDRLLLHNFEVLVK